MGGEGESASHREKLTAGVLARARHLAQAAGIRPSDLLLDLVNWVKQGQAPDQVIGTQADARGQVVRTRPVYAYPLVARSTGQGSMDDAANFPPPPPRAFEDQIEWAGSQSMPSAAAR